MATTPRLSTRPPVDPAKGASKANTPPSAATSQYPPVAVSRAIPTTGRVRGVAPMEPEKRASPKANTPPSAATSQYPASSAVAAMPTTGACSTRPPVDPAKGASKANTPPSDATSQ